VTPFVGSALGEFGVLVVEAEVIEVDVAAGQ
jgi:hypothetical protein